MMSSMSELIACAGTGLFLEFGVASGDTVNDIAKHIAPREVFGFDSFEGLPEDWVYDGNKVWNRKGVFRCDVPTDLSDNVILVKGLFQDTLPRFLTQHSEPVAFVHIDCDLYSSTKFVLMTLSPRLDGAIVVFDEMLRHKAYEEHECRAFAEFLSETGHWCEYLGQQHFDGAGFRVGR